MCPKDPLIHLLVSNIGPYSRSNGDSWSVPLPQMLQGKGSCSITVVSARVNPNSAITNTAKIWISSNIPVMGMSTQTGQLGELCEMDLFHATTLTRQVFYQLAPLTYRVIGGLPLTLEFNAWSLLSTQVAGDPFTADKLTLLNTALIEFRLEIVFDEDIKKM